MALELSLQAAADLEAERAQVLTHWTHRLERAHYEVTRAFRQYNGRGAGTPVGGPAA